MIRRILTVVLYLVLLSVVVSSIQSIVIGVTAKPRYQAVFPGARGAMYWVTLLASLAAGANCVLIALRRRWAIFINPAIGLASIALLEAVGGPRMNELVVLIACTLSTALAWHLWGRRPPAREPVEGVPS